MRPYRGIAALITLLAALCAPASAAAAITPLALHGFGYLATDPVNGHIYVTGAVNQPNSTIAVAGASGALLHTITNEPQAAGLAVAGGKLYVSLCDQDAIDVIDTSTYQRVERISLGATGIGGHCEIALGDGVLWFESTQGGASPELATVTLDANHTVQTTALTAPSPIFRLTPDLHTLAIGSTSTTTDVLVYDVSTSTPVQVGRLRTVWDDFSELTDLTFAPDGSRLYPVSYWMTSIRGFTPIGDAGTDGYLWGYNGGYSAAVAPNGYVVATGTGGYNMYAINVFDFQKTTPEQRWMATSSTGGLEPAALTFSADGSKLYAITGQPSVSPHGLGLVTLSTGWLMHDTLRLVSSPKSPIVGKPAIVNGVLRYDDGVDPTGRTVHLTLRAPNGKLHVLPPRLVDERGRFAAHFGTTLTARGVWRLIAHVAASGSHGAVDTSFVLHVRSPTLLSSALVAKLISTGGRTTVVIHSSLPRGAVVTLKGTPIVGGPITTRAVRIGRSGIARVVVSPRWNTAYSVHWAGNTLWAPRTSRSVRIGVRAHVSGRMLSPYGHSGSLALFHYTTSCWASPTYCPYFEAAVSGGNHDGTYIGAQLQRRSGSGWVGVTAAQSSYPLDYYGKVELYLQYQGPGAIGMVYRFRIHFPGDDRNAATTGPWTYFKITS